MFLFFVFLHESILKKKTHLCVFWRSLAILQLMTEIHFVKGKDAINKPNLFPGYWSDFWKKIIHEKNILSIKWLELQNVRQIQLQVAKFYMHKALNDLLFLTDKPKNYCMWEEFCRQDVKICRGNSGPYMLVRCGVLFLTGILNSIGH